MSYEDTEIPNESYRGFALASNAEPVCLVLEQRPPKTSGENWEELNREWFVNQAVNFADALQQHAPQGFIDHLLAELALRRASILHVKK